MEAAAARPEIDVVVAPKTWLRRSPMTGGMAVTYLLFGLGAIVLFVAPAPPPARWEAGLVGAIFCLPCLLIAQRWYRAGLWIAADGVAVRGSIRTRRLSLSEVDSFYMESPGSPLTLLYPYGIQIGRGRSRPVSVRALAKFGWADEEGLERATAEWQPTVDALNELLASLKGSSVPEPQEVRLTRGDARLFVVYVACSNALAEAMLLGAALVTPGARTPLLILAAVYLPIGVAITIYMRRHANRRIGKTSSDP